MDAGCWCPAFPPPPLAKPRPSRLGSSPLVFMSTTAKAPSKCAASKNAASLHREHSRLVVDGYERAASRAMLHAVGFAREDFKKSQVGIASTWSMVTPCNMHIDQLARQAEAGAKAGGGKAGSFGPITLSHPPSLCTDGMNYSLLS